MSAERLLALFERIVELPDRVSRMRQFVLDLGIRGRLGSKSLWPTSPSTLRTVATLQNGYAFKSEWFAKDGVWLLRNANVGHGVLRWDDQVRLSKEHAKEFERFQLAEGDVVLSLDRPFIVTGTKVARVRLQDLPCLLLQRVGRFQPITERLNPDYLFLWLHSSYFTGQIDPGRSNGVPHISSKQVESAQIFVPPLSEQHRIVAKVDELMALCDRLEAAQAERESRRDRLVSASLHRLNQPAEDATAFRADARFALDHLARFTTRPEHIPQLRQTILNLAVRGKLVPQDPKDEPAPAVLERSKAEVGRLVETGQIRKANALPTIEADSTPFTLPAGWVWSRFPELGEFCRGKSRHRPRNDSSLYMGGKYKLVQTGDVARANGVIVTHTGLYNEVGLAQSRMWPAGTMCITIAANIADSALLGFDACIPDSVVGFIPVSIFGSAKYFEFFMRTAKAHLVDYAPSTAQKNINIGILETVLIPLPPLAEQHRIVAKVDELMALCDRLGAQLTTTQTESRRLLEAVLHEALVAVG